MKKLLSTAMAIAMMASMTALSSAAVASIDTTIHTLNDDNKIEAFTDETVPYGDTLYMPLLDEESAGVTAYDDVRSMTIKSTWDMNGSAISKVEIVKKKAATDDVYYYFLGFNTKDSTSTSITDISGEVTLRKSGQDSIVQDVDFSLGYPMASDELYVEDFYQIHEFGGDTEDMINFNGGYFLVNTLDQDELLMSCTTRYNSDVAAKYPSANLDFITFNNVSFNRIGELTIYADEGSYLYTLSSSGALTPVNTTFDEYEDAFKFKTRTLGSFVISDSELSIIVEEEDSDDDIVVEDDVVVDLDAYKPNPGTGAKA